MEQTSDIGLGMVSSVRSTGSGAFNCKTDRVLVGLDSVWSLWLIQLYSVKAT